MNGKYYENIRIVPELRNYHVTLHDKMTPGKIYFFQEKYDLAHELLPPKFHKVTPVGLIREMFRSEAESLEIWEPLWVRLLGKHVLTVSAWKLRGWIKRKPSRVVSYAMENNDLGSLVGGNLKAPAILTKAFGLAVGTYIRFCYTRIAYASTGSRDLYQGIPGVRHVQSDLILNLPARKAARPGGPADGLGHSLVAMVARMEKRKGSGVIREVWPMVESMVPDSCLLLIGDGPEGASLETWAAQRPASRRFIGHVSHEKLEGLLMQCSVLVLPSVREGRWREQIGLPIQEGLLAGLTVVTSDETGLAAWLSDHGHCAVPPGQFPRKLAKAIATSLKRPLDPEKVVASLPTQDGRVSANHWMQSKL